jgi:hypothetical protein
MAHHLIMDTSMTRNELHKLLIKLRTMVKAGNYPSNYRTGICGNLDTLCEFYVSPLVRKYQESWTWYSGDWIFPVPAPSMYDDTYIDPKAGAVAVYMNTRNKWTGEYGKLRLSLLNHLIRMTR